MKKAVVLLTLITGVALINAQKSQQQDVPSSVQKAFKKRFPNIKNGKWEKEKDNYEVHFKLETKGTSVVFNPAGNLLETESEISYASFSAPIKKYIAKNYPNQKIKEAAKIIDSEGIVTYEAEIDGKDLIFDNKGKFLREIKN